MEVDYARLTSRERYKLMVSCLVPRPIALVSTWNLDGLPNAAPFSFFNAVSDDPPAIAIGVNSGIPGHVKDTARNIRSTGEFIVNLVDEPLAQAMNLCGLDLPPNVSEFEIAGITSVPGSKVHAPRVAESPISFECKRIVNVEIGIGRNVIIGEIVHLHIRDDLINTEKLHIHAERAGLIGRMHGLGWYARTTDLLEMPRVSLDDVTSLATRSGNNDA